MSQVRTVAYKYTKGQSRTNAAARRRALSEQYGIDVEDGATADIFARMSARDSLDVGPGEPMLPSISAPRLSTMGSVLEEIKVHWWVRDSTALKEIVFGSYINLLLLVVPLGLAAGFFKWPATWVFVLNFVSLIPLALILGDVTEDLALRYGAVVGGLINATFGNVVEVILSIAALFNGLYGVVAASLLGSILSNMLLVAGCAFFFGGLFNKTQKFNATGNQACSSLLFLASVGFLIPTAATQFFTDPSTGKETKDQLVLDISRWTALVMLVCYLCYLGFQLYTHTDLFDEGDDGGSDEGEGGDHEEPMMTVATSVALLTGITIIVAINSEYLTGSLEEFSERSRLGTAFVSTIVLPIAGNACEHLTAVVVATKNKMDLAMGVAVGSGIQIALFALPFAVLVAWVAGLPFSLSFDPFSAMVLLLSVVQSNFVTSGAMSHWLLGVQLIALYVIISVAFLFK